MRRFLFLLAVPFSLAGQITVHLSPATNQAFDTYVSAAEAKMDWKPHIPSSVKKVDVQPWDAKSPIDVENGLIHDWVASVVVAGASVERALEHHESLCAVSESVRRGVKVEWKAEIEETVTQPEKAAV